MSSKIEIINEIKSFLEGKNEDLKYLVNVETNPATNKAMCVFHRPNQMSKIEEVPYQPFLYTKDLKRLGHQLYNGDIKEKLFQMKLHGISFEILKTGNQERLKNGYCIKYTSSISYNSLIDFFAKGGLDPNKKIMSRGQPILDDRGRVKYMYRDLFYIPRLNDQFFISTGARLFKGMNEYKDVHKLTFDIETTNLRPKISRVFAIGVRDNRGYEKVLEVKKENDDESERDLIRSFFSVINMRKPAIIMGFNSESFDFDFLITRMEILGMSIYDMKTTLVDYKSLYRRKNVTLKLGNTTEKYTATEMYGFSVIDIYHAARKTAAVNSDMKNTRLKYICKFEGIAKPNRMYIDGEGGNIGKLWLKNSIYVVNSKNNNYLEIPESLHEAGNKLYVLQDLKKNIDPESYAKQRNEILENYPEFVKWYRENMDQPYDKFMRGREILHQYLLDDLWETEKVDDMYNQSTFLLAKIVPTTYTRVATMGNAAIWNLLMTAWSYENGLAIPYPDKIEKFSGGLTRCYKKGYSENIVKIDYASLYPMIQLTWDIFPTFDITGVLKKMLIYMTTTRNIYKKLAAYDDMNDDEVGLLEHLDIDTYKKYVHNSIVDDERLLFKVKQLPIKIINNSLFGSLGSGVSFNWSDNICASRITCTGRLQLRRAISWFRKYKCIALLAVTDGVNFSIPYKTNIMVTDNNEWIADSEVDIDVAWQFNGKKGISALIEKYNKEEMIPPFMSVDNDGKFLATLNLSRINYALLYEKKNKKTGIVERKIKFTGNTIKSKVMPEYIEDFIDKGLEMILEGKGFDFVEYYYEYAEKIYRQQIPLKKIATKKKLKDSIDGYLNRGLNKNGKPKGKQAHMELLIVERDETIKRIFNERYPQLIKDGVINVDDISTLSLEKKHELIADYMPSPRELDSVVYYVNIGNKAGQGDSTLITLSNGKQILSSRLISSVDLDENPEMIGQYNGLKYFNAFNKRVKVLLEGFDPEIRNKILAQVIRTKIKKSDQYNEKFFREYFTPDELKLVSVDHDNYDESMILEEREIEFWNRSGYNPQLIWNGFSVSNENPLRTEIYDHALKFLNDQMINAGKKPIKSINEQYGKGDYILFKNFDEYSVGYHNGDFIEIVRENVKTVVLTDEEIEFERKQKEKIAERQRLGIPESDDEFALLTEAYPEFLEKWKIKDPKFTMLELIRSNEKACWALLDFFEEWKYENGYENEVEEYDTYEEYD